MNLPILVLGKTKIIDGRVFLKRQQHLLCSGHTEECQCPARMEFGIRSAKVVERKHAIGCEAFFDNEDGYLLNGIINRKFIYPSLPFNNVELTPLDPEQEEASRIKKFFNGGMFESETYTGAKLVKIYKVKKQNEPEFPSSILSWHGSPVRNIRSILENGLMLRPPPQVKINGADCGHGIYSSWVAAMAMKFCEPLESDTHCVMLLLEVRADNFVKVSTLTEAVSLSSSRNVFVEGRVGYEVDLEELTPKVQVPRRNARPFNSKTVESTYDQIRSPENHVKIRYAAVASIIRPDA
jgi:hypothetical protein